MSPSRLINPLWLQGERCPSSTRNSLARKPERGTSSAANDKAIPADKKSQTQGMVNPIVCASLPEAEKRAKWCQELEDGS